MAEFTEEELLNAVDGEESTTTNDDTADLAEELATEETPAEAEPAQPESSEETEDKEPEATEEQAEAEPAEEPEQPEAEEPDPVVEEEPKMILGKFKTQDDLIKAYQNLEKKFGEKAKEVKEAAQVTTDDFDKAVDAKIVEENMKVVGRALDTIADPEHAKEAQYLWYQAQKTGDPAFFEKARGFLDPRVDRRLEVEMANTAAQIRMQANAHREEILFKPLSEELDKMAEEDPEFMNDEQNQNLMAMAIKLNPATVDVRAVKKAIQDYNKMSYQKGYEAAKKEFAKQVEKQTVSVKSVAHMEEPVKKKPVDAMSIEEQLEEELQDLF